MQDEFGSPSGTARAASDCDAPAIRLSLNLEFVDLTERARSDGFSRILPRADSAFASVIEGMARSLHRRRGNSILLTGLGGVGKTAAVWDLSRRAASREIQFLADKRFLWVDCRRVPSQASSQALAVLLASLKNRQDVILCLDGLGLLLSGSAASINRQQLQLALAIGSLRIIGVMSNRDYDESIAGDYEMLELFNRVVIQEPDDAAALSIIQYVGRGLEEDYGLRIDEQAVRRAVVLSANYIMNERLPAKAVKILERACDDVQYDRLQLGASGGNVTTKDIIRVVAEISGVSEATLTGVGDAVDYRQSLEQLVFGQPEAVHVVATELGLIKSGLVDPSKPASVMLFAGQTGTGKTELAKTVAKLYSSSKRLHTYSMGNFTEPHSVSGVIGVPPGYVGYDAGGRLINELNADPYSVILLDEVEKCHPDVLKPFLHLFDEGWVADQRGVKAYADRAIVIMTSNVGENILSEMAKAGESIDRIMERVKAAFAGIRNPRSNLPVFSAAFLSRIKRIVIFRPLDQSAMEGICRRMLAELQMAWRQKREKSIVISESLMKWIGEKAHELNQRSGGKEGGRVVRKLITDLIEANVQQATALRPDEYRQADEVLLEITAPGASESRSGTTDPSAAAESWNGPPVRVVFRADPQHVDD